MTLATDDNQLGPRVRTMQIIVVAMLVGSAFFLVICVSLHDPRPARPPDAAPLVTYMGLGFAVVTAVLSFVMPVAVVAGARNRIVNGTFGDPRIVVPPDDTGKLLGVYQTALIIGAALLEGPTFFLAIAYLLEGQIISLIAAGVLMGALAARFPTPARVTAWLDRQLSLIDQARQSST
jgi:hypothetical protein